MSAVAPARAVASALEPFAGQVYFSPECHERYEALGFSGSPASMGAVALPDGPAYFCSRGSVLGQVDGELIAAAFAVFNPAVVVPAVDHGWSFTDAATICEARTEGAVGQLRPEGRPLYAGLLALDEPDHPLGVAWRLADELREYRGDAHTASWTSAGFDATEIGLLSELYWGLGMRTYVRSRAWSDADLDAAEARLAERGLVADGALTDAGRAEREAVEETTDRQCRPIVDALGDDLGELVTILGGWSDAIRAAAGYPAAGPHDLAALASRRS